MRTPCLAILVVLSMVAGLTPGQVWADVYNPIQLRVLLLTLNPNDWMTVVNDPSFSIEVPAMFGELGETPILVSVRRKSSIALGQKVALKIDINEYVPGQTWNDLRKLSLENGADEDVVAEGFAWLLHRLAAAQLNGHWFPNIGQYLPGLSAWCALLVNGQYLGVYVNVEQVDKRFMQHRNMWIPGQTWLYKVSDAGGQATLEEGTGDSPTTQILCYSPFESPSPCPPPPAATIHTQISTLINMPAWLHYAAASAFHAGPDQLFSHGKNFWFIDQLGAQRMYVPWDMDSVFTGGGVNSSIYGQGNGNNLQQTAYQQTVLNDPVFRAQYNTILDTLLAGHLSAPLLVAILDFLEQGTLLPLALQLDPNNNLPGTVADRFNSLRSWVTQRAANVQAQTP